MYIAQFLSKRQEAVDDFKKTFLPVLVVIVVVCALIGVADLSTAAVLFATSMLLLFIGRISAKHLFALFGTGTIVIGILIFAILKSDTNIGRVATWKSRIENYVQVMGGDETAESYQNQQANIAIANGGLTGRGPGKGDQRNFLPLAFSDFIYAIILEEYGLLGGLFVMGLYLTLMWRAVLIVVHSPKSFWCATGHWAVFHPGYTSLYEYGCCSAFVAKYRFALTIHKHGWNQSALYQFGYGYHIKRKSFFESKNRNRR